MYKIYPTLLNTFSLYRRGLTNEQGQTYVSFEELIDRINRVPKPANEAQQRGTDFETALLKGEGEEAFAPTILAEMRKHLPARYRTQVYVQARIKNVLLYGFVDVVGATKAIDIKTTSHYTPDKFGLNHQNLYLLGLRDLGIRQLEYLITDFSAVYLEKYQLNSYNFDPLFEELTAFVEFVETHRALITDTKIFGT